MEKGCGIAVRPVALWLQPQQAAGRVFDEIGRQWAFIHSLLGKCCLGEGMAGLARGKDIKLFLFLVLVVGEEGKLQSRAKAARIGFGRRKRRGGGSSAECWLARRLGGPAWFLAQQEGRKVGVAAYGVSAAA